jgi:hypothetical protein
MAPPRHARRTVLATVLLSVPPAAATTCTGLYCTRPPPPPFPPPSIPSPPGFPFESYSHVGAMVSGMIAGIISGLVGAVLVCVFCFKCEKQVDAIKRWALAAGDLAPPARGATARNGSASDVPRRRPSIHPENHARRSFCADTSLLSYGPPVGANREPRCDGTPQVAAQADLNSMPELAEAMPLSTGVPVGSSPRDETSTSDGTFSPTPRPDTATSSTRTPSGTRTLKFGGSKFYKDEEHEMQQVV